MPEIRTISGTSDTPGASDATKMLRCTNTGATTVTLAGASFSAGDAFGVESAGGMVTFAAGSGTSSIVGDRFLWRSEAFVMYLGSGAWVVYGAGKAFTAEQFGAVGDGTTDDTAAIQAALNAAAANIDAAQGEPQAGGTVRLAPSMYRLTSTLIVPGNVNLVGAGVRATVLLADSAWNVGTSPYMVRMGTIAERISGGYLMDLEVNGNAVTGLRGVISDTMSEHSGIRGVRFLNCMLGAVRSEWTGTAGSDGASNHFSIVDVDDLLGVACDDNRIAFDLTSTNPASKCYLSRITIHNDVANITGKQTATGFFANRIIQGRDLHIEGCALGVNVSAADSVSLVGVDGDPETDFLIRLQSNMAGKAVFLADVRDNGAAVTLRDAADVNTTGDIALWTSGRTEVVSQPIWIPAASFAATAGSPALVSAGTIDATFRFDAAASEWVGTQVIAPTRWATMRVTLYWCNTGTGSGNVVWRSSVGSTGSGEVLGASATTGDSVTVGAPTVANQVVVSVLDDDVPVTRGEVMSVGINRFANAAGDTLAADAALVGVLLERVS